MEFYWNIKGIQNSIKMSLLNQLFYHIVGFSHYMEFLRNLNESIWWKFHGILKLRNQLLVNCSPGILMGFISPLCGSLVGF